ncbi:MAG: RecB family exonuclease [Minisyncoccia bacterium]
MRTSYSNLEIFENCPKRYEFQVIDKIKAPTTKEQFLGTLLHKSLAFLYKKAPLFPHLDELLDYFRVQWKEADKIKWRNNEEKENYFKEGLRILESFYKKNIPSFSIPLALESYFETEIEDEQNNTTHIVTGRIDRIDKKEDETFEIIDYKTSKKMPSEDSLTNNLQLAVYILGFLKKWPHLTSIDKINLTLYYLKHGEYLTGKKTENDISLTKKRILKNIHEIEKNYFPPIPSKLCNSCPYRKICPMWSHLYQKEKTPEEVEIKKLISEYFKLKEEADNNKIKLEQIKKEINRYAEEKQLGRIFGEEGFFAYQTQQIKEYDMEKLKNLLIKTNLWNEVSMLDKKRLEKLLKKLDSSLLQQIEQLQKVKNRKVLKAFKKDIAIIKKTLEEE